MKSVNEDATKWMEDNGFESHIDCCLFCSHLIDFERGSPNERLCCEYMISEDADATVNRDSRCNKFTQK